MQPAVILSLVALCISGAGARRIDSLLSLQPRGHAYLQPRDYSDPANTLSRRKVLHAGHPLRPPQGGFRSRMRLRGHSHHPSHPPSHPTHPHHPEHPSHPDHPDHPSPATEPEESGHKPNTRQKAQAFLSRIKSKNGIKVAGDVAKKLAGVTCDLNNLAGIFDQNNQALQEVSNGVTVACTAGNVIQTVRGGKEKQKGKEKRDAGPETEAEADAEAEDDGVLFVRWFDEEFDF